MLPNFDLVPFLQPHSSPMYNSGGNVFLIPAPTTIAAGKYPTTMLRTQTTPRAPSKKEHPASTVRVIHMTRLTYWSGTNSLSPHAGQSNVVPNITLSIDTL